MAWDSGFQLRVRDKQGEHVFPLHSKTVSVGRAIPGKRPSLKLCLLEDPLVSRHHLTLKWQLFKKAYMLCHESKTNSTIVNGEPSKRVLLAPGDLILIGDVKMRFERVEAAQAAEKQKKTLPQPETSKNEADSHLGQPTEKEVVKQPEAVVPERPLRKKPGFSWKPPEER